MKRVVIITNIPAPYRVELFDYLQKHTEAYEIHIVYASRNEDNRSWHIDEAKMRNSHFLDSYTIKIPRRYDTKYIHISKGVAKLLAELKPDLVVGSEYNPTILQAVHYCSRKKIPYISWTDGTLHSERNIGRLQRKFRHYVISHAAAYLASSTRSREAQIAYGAQAEKCFVSLLTVDVDQYRVEQANRQANRLLCVGSLIERKGIDLLLRALNGIEEPWELALAGGGSEEEALHSLAQELGIGERVHFLGYLSREELKREYAKSGIFVLPTREDCYALVILEAMCAGLPIVSSIYADGAYDMIENGENGVLVDPYQEEEFRTCLRELLQQPEKAEKMGQKSLNLLDKFRFEQVSKGFWDVFDYVLRRR